VAGIEILSSRDTRDHVRAIEQDPRFLASFVGMSLTEIADSPRTKTDAAAGATLTSLAISEALVRRLGGRGTSRRFATEPGLADLRLLFPDAERMMTDPGDPTVIRVVTGFTRLRGTWFGRLAVPVAVLLYFGFGAGALLSQAQLWGWAQAGVPRGAAVLVALAAALVLPVTTRGNIYCGHLCAHGAAQQLLVRFVKPKGRVPAVLRPWLVALPWILLALAIAVAVAHLPLNLVDLEPFDAYLPTVAGVAARSSRCSRGSTARSARGGPIPMSRGSTRPAPTSGWRWQTISSPSSRLPDACIPGRRARSTSRWRRQTAGGRWASATCASARLEALGSAGHLVELGGEVRAWGMRPDGTRWRVWLPAADAASGRSSGQTLELAPGEALGTASCKPGRSPIDPRTGRLATPSRVRATVRARTCAEADALAVAALLSGDADDALPAGDP